MTKPDDKPKAVLKRLKDPLYDQPAGGEGREARYYADGRVVTRLFKEGKTVVERGRCWTCKHIFQGPEEDDYDCECPDVPEVEIGEETPQEKWGIDADADPCPYWKGDIGVCEKHGEYLRREGCIECQLERMEEEGGRLMIEKVHPAIWLTMTVANAVLSAILGAEIAPVLWGAAAICKAVEMLAKDKEDREHAAVTWGICCCLALAAFLAHVIGGLL